MSAEERATVVLVEWLDAHAASDGWCYGGELEAEGCLVRTIGFLLPDAKPDHVSVAQSIADDDDLYHVFCIPVGMVRSMRVVSDEGANPCSLAPRQGR